MRYFGIQSVLTLVFVAFFLGTVLQEEERMAGAFLFLGIFCFGIWLGFWSGKEYEHNRMNELRRLRGEIK